MNRTKRGLAALLAALMLIPTLPTHAAEGEAPEVPDVLPAIVVYNLLEQEVTVGTDATLAEENPETYKLFAEDDSYTIELEDNAFFPYEVQFTYDGATWEEWFETPESTVDVGEHTFRVVSQNNDPNQLAQIGFTIGGKYIAARPEAKEFTAEPGISVFSLLPLEEKRLNVDLIGYLPGELKNVPLTTIFSGQSIEAESAVVWAQSYDNDAYAITDMSGTVDLIPEYTQARLALIVGTADQLDPNNTRYLVYANITPPHKLLTARAATTADLRSTIDVYSTSVYENSGQNILQIGVDKADWQRGQEAYLSVGLNDAFNATDLSAKVYQGYYATEAEAVAAGAEDVTDQMWATDPTASGFQGDYNYKSNYQGMPEFTVVLKRGEVIVLEMPFVAYMYATDMSLSAYNLYADRADGTGRDHVSNGSDYDYDNAHGYAVYTIKLQSGYSANGTYYLGISLNNPADPENSDNGLSYVTKAVVGDYDTQAAAASSPDIKTALFGNAYQDGQGYGADFSGGVVFTVFATNGEVLKLYVKTVEGTTPDALPPEPEPDSEDTYFRINSANKDGGGYLNAYTMPYDDDGYYYNGYQPVFLLNSDGTPVTDANVIPVFYTGNNVTMYAGHNGNSGTKQESGVTSVPFEAGTPIQYSAAAQNHQNLKNYWVTFLTQVPGGAELFVNAANDASRIDETTGLPVREVFLDENHNNRHDVFFANVGDAVMNGLYARLEDPVNVALDPYWTIQEDGVTSLAAFTTTTRKNPNGNYVSYGELPNVAKLRLIPVEGSAGFISGTLVIGYDNGGTDKTEVKIKLTGVSGIPKITTTDVLDGVKYVPYSSVIQTNNMYADDAVQFTITAGNLPTGVILKPNGELYGVPTVTGDFTFTVKAAYNGDDALSDSKEFTMSMLQNTNDNVEKATDVGYQLLDRVPADMTSYSDQVFTSQGALGEFKDFWLDGRKLSAGTDYTAESGSTRITIRSQTFQSAGNGTHTISAEFRTNGAKDGDLKRAAQNYTMTSANSGGDDHGGGGNGGGNGGSNGGGNAKPKPKPTPVPTPAPKPLPTPGKLFSDVEEDAWYYTEIKWIQENGLMVGIGDGNFAPNAPISGATVATVLARLAKVDLTQYTGEGWYGPSMAWCATVRIFGDKAISPLPPLPRGELAVALVNYLDHLGIAHLAPETPMVFADATAMTPEEDATFQVLYAMGIFKGKGENVMDPDGVTTRAELAVLLHRLSVFVESQEL